MVPRGNAVLVTWPDYDMNDPHLGGALLAAGLEVRLEPKRGLRSPADLAPMLDGMLGAIVSTDPFTAEVLAGAPALRVIARVGVGYDSIDVAAASAHGVQVVTTPGANDRVVADHTIGLMLALLRRVPELERDMRSGGWNRTGRHTPRQLCGATVGLVGYGAIGRLVAERLHGFRVELLIHDPALGDDSTPLDDVLRRSDVISLHCPLLPATRHLINADALHMMKPDAVLVNAARGAIVDEAALIEALRSGVISGAALDVFETEPPAGSPLLTMDNVVVSPHVAGISTVSVAEMCRLATQAVLDVFAGRPPSHVVNSSAQSTTN
ncbi:MAG: phosphoglycerate dehydrogenase [Ilumatobacteraceae bacterium]